MKLFFVVPSEGGRIISSHLFTIRKVLQSITLPDGTPPGANSYGVIVNKCDISSPEKEAKIIEGFAVESKRVPVPTGHTTFLPRVEELRGKDNATYNFKGLNEFVLDFPGIKIRKASEINVKDIDMQLEEFHEAAAEELAKREQMHEADRKKWE